MAKLSPSELKRQALEALLNGTEDEGEGAGLRGRASDLVVGRVIGPPQTERHHKASAGPLSDTRITSGLRYRLPCRINRLTCVRINRLT